MRLRAFSRGIAQIARHNLRCHSEPESISEWESGLEFEWVREHFPPEFPRCGITTFAVIPDLNLNASEGESISAREFPRWHVTHRIAISDLNLNANLNLNLNEVESVSLQSCPDVTPQLSLPFQI
jgi:hypothetical protein